MIDGWTVTTTDTAIVFRKFSRGAVWLEWSVWREFLAELAAKKGLPLRELEDKLEMSGRPAVTKPKK